MSLRILAAFTDYVHQDFISKKSQDRSGGGSFVSSLCVLMLLDAQPAGAIIASEGLKYDGDGGSSWSPVTPNRALEPLSAW